MAKPTEPAPPSRRLLARWAAWFAVGNALLLAAVALRYFAFVALPSEPLAQLFLALIVPGQSLLLAALPLPLVGAAAWVAPGRWVLGLGVALYALLAMALLVDSWVFALYRFHIDSSVYALLVSGVAHEILPIAGTTLGRAGLVLALLVVLEAALARATLAAVRRRGQLRGAPVGAVLLAVVLLGHGLHAWADAALYTPITRQMRGLPWLDGLSAYRFAEARGWLPRELGAARPVPPSDSAFAYPRAPLRCERRAAPASVLLIAIEEWRFDEFDPTTTPNLWRFARDGWRFHSHFSSGNASRYGLFGLLYGLHGSYWDAALAEQRGSLLIAEAARRDYRTAVLSSASLLHPEFDRTAFAELRETLPARRAGLRPHERDRAITDAFLAFLAEPDPRPFFGFLFYDSPHSLDHPPDREGPYAPALERLDHLALGPDFDPVPLRNRHRNSVHYVDALVGEVLDALVARGLLEATAVVVTGDHGEEFNDTGENYWGHNGNFTRYQTQVPLIARLPARDRGDVHALTSHVDVVPTLMQEVFGCEAPTERYSNGRSLFDRAPRPYVVASGGSRGIALIEPLRLTWIGRTGGIRVLDHRLRALRDAPPDLVQVRRVLEEMSAFYAR